MTALDDLTAAELRAMHARTTSEPVRRAIKRRLQQLDNQTPPAPPTPTPPKKPQMQESDFRDRFLALRPPTTRPWWSLAQIAETLDRTTAEWHERSKEGK